MTRGRVFVLMLSLCCFCGGGLAGAVEGKWTPEQVLDQDPAWLRSPIDFLADEAAPLFAEMGLAAP
jgi:hypothetical protein